MKEYFFWLDSRFVPHVPQSAQRVLVQNYASKIGGKIVYYSAEEWIAVEKQLGLRQKLKRTSGIAGFIFFTLKQFAYGTQFDYQLLHEMTLSGLEVHFAREEYGIRSSKDLNCQFERLYLYNWTNKKNNKLFVFQNQN